MSFITGLTRMWLTRTTKPFTFKNEYDQILPFAECENLGLYVHIPFCKSICNFCPYCKVRYSAELCDRYIDALMKEGAPVFNLKSAFPYLIENRFPTPCHQCVVMENGKLSTCGRCIDVPGLCDQCGYFFVAEYTLLFRGNLKIIFEMLHTYLKYI